MSWQTMNPALERWRGIGWELIREQAYSPALNLAIDQLLTHQVQSGQRPPTLRFWGWSARAIILGRFQSVRNEVDLETAKALNVEVARRMSGGGAMFVEPDRTITYSLYMPEKLLEGLTIKGSYEACDSWVVDCFQRMGIDAWYAPLNDITSSKGKIGGAAQARKPGVVLHHTTIAYHMDEPEMQRLLRIGRGRLSDKGIPSAEKKVNPLRNQTELSRIEVVRLLTDCFRERFGLAEAQLRDDELCQAHNLIRDRYGLEQWTFELP
jgi:lipoate-protein ligase A